MGSEKNNTMARARASDRVSRHVVKPFVSYCMCLCNSMWDAHAGTCRNLCRNLPVCASASNNALMLQWFFYRNLSEPVPEPSQKYNPYGVFLQLYERCSHWNLPEPVQEPAQKKHPCGVFLHLYSRRPHWNLPEPVQELART